MLPDFQIELTDEAGIPAARVPHELAWDLVDHLSAQRLCVTYRYQATSVVAYFHHTDHTAVRALLDEWSVTKTAASPVKHKMAHLDRWLVGHHA